MEIRPINEADVKRVIRAVKKNRMVCINKETETALKVAEGGLTGCKTLSLNTLRDAIYQDAVEHGLWMDTDGPMRCASQIAGEVEELSEEAGNVLEARCDGVDETEAWNDYCEELADVVITCFSVAGKLDIDIDAAIRKKMEFNHNRPWKHGKK